LKAETNGLAHINLDIVRDPADTMLATEKAAPNNQLYTLNATIRTTSEHVDGIRLRNYHGGLINYLMVDGHVASLKPETTVGWQGQSGTNAATHKGIWTIKAGD